MKQYISKISEFNLLTPEEEYELAVLAQTGDKLAKEKLITANLRLVIPVAKKYSGVSELSLDDLIQEGNMGLMLAADRFDPALGNKFSTFATWWIKQKISRAAAKNFTKAHTPTSMAELYTKMVSVRKDLTQKFQREPSIEELASELNCSYQELSEILNAKQSVISLDKSFENAEEGSLGDFIASDTFPAPDSDAALGHRTAALKDIVNTLSEREAYIILSRFGIDSDSIMTLAEIGQNIGLSRERVRQLEEKALIKLNHPLRRELLEDWLLS